MATKTTNKNATPRIHKKWYEFKIDPKTLRPIRFHWDLASGRKNVVVYEDVSVHRDEIIDMTLRRYVTSYYFVYDKSNKRIFAYPVHLANNDTRSSCNEAHYEKQNANCFYMFDENKQIWEIPYHEYRQCMGYNYAERQYVYETVKAEPRKKSRLSTYYYKIQCQRTEYIRKIFGELYGKDFVYQNHLVTDYDIRNNGWIWNCWLSTKGRKYSDKTKKAVANLMDNFSDQQREYNADKKNGSHIVLETSNGVTALCYYSYGKETFRRIFNDKTGKLDNFIWRNNQWSKTNKLTSRIGIDSMSVDETYKKAHSYDWDLLEEALNYYNRTDDHRRYWYSPHRCFYEFIVKYISNPVIHQLLQIMKESGRQELYGSNGSIEKIFGAIPNRGKTMYSKLGVSKYQFDNPDVIVYVKWLLNLKNISHIDNATWDKYTKAFSGKVTARYGDNDIIDYLKSSGEFTPDRWIKICALNDQHANCGYGYSSDRVKQLYKDYYRSLSAMKEFGIDISAYPVVFNDIQQLQRFHDDAAKAVSSVRNKAQDEKFSMLYSKRIKMLEDDGEYCIEMPKCSSDLTEEGSKLRHCVGGYVNSVANGHTAIYFLRKSCAPDEPWLTVEVSNKQCRQIHGSCNAWMGSKDEYFAAVPFLVYWFEKHDIQYNENLLTNMATGYGASSSHRAMPTQAINLYMDSRKMKKSS
jgi:hypothetical protein